MKNEPEDFEGDVPDEELKLKNVEEADEQLAIDEVTSENKNNAGSDDKKVDGQVTETSLKGKSDYMRNKAKNIAELKRELDKVKEQYPLPDGLEQKPVVKKLAKRKDKMQGDKVIRRESLRSNQPKWVLLWPSWRCHSHVSQLIDHPYCSSHFHLSAGGESQWHRGTDKVGAITSGNNLCQQRGLTELYWPYQSGTSCIPSWSSQWSPGHRNHAFDHQFRLHIRDQLTHTC